MKNLRNVIAASLIALPLTAGAWTGSAEDKMEHIEAALIANDERKPSDLVKTAWFYGVVAGASMGFNNHLNWTSAICYPPGVILDTLSTVAAQFIVDNPDLRDNQLPFLIWWAHLEEFGSKDSDGNCEEKE